MIHYCNLEFSAVMLSDHYVLIKNLLFFFLSFALKSWPAALMTAPSIFSVGM